MDSAVAISPPKSSAGIDTAFSTLLILVFLAAAWISFSFSGTLVATGASRVQDVWFDGDLARVFANLTDRFSDHYRNAVHPLSSLLLSTPTIALTQLGLSAELAARLTMATGAGFLAMTFLLLCYRLTGGVLDALIYTLLLMSSAGFLFFATVFELYAWGAFSIVAALLCATVSGRYKAAALIAGSAVSLSFTVTNWMAGLAVTALAEPPRRAALYTVMAFATVAALAAVQSNLYRTSGKFLYLGEEARYAKIDIRQKIQAVPRAFFVDPIIFPGVGSGTDKDGKRFLMAQPSANGASLVHKFAVLTWIALFGAGAAAAWSAWRRRSNLRRMAMLASGVTAGQLILHVFYGSWFFLYSLHYAPLLVLLASFASASKWRLPCLAGALVLAGLAAANNVAGFEQAIEFMQPSR